MRGTLLFLTKKINSKNMYGMNMNPLGFAMPVAPMEGSNRNNDNAMWNNPFMYLIFLALFGRMNGGGLFGGGDGSAAGAVTAAQIDDIKAKAAAILQGVNQNDACMMNELNQLTAQVNANGRDICASRTDILGALSNIQHNLTLQGCQMASQMQQCCCETKQAIQEVGCGVEKGLLNQTIQLNQGLCNTNQNINQVGTALGNGISNLGFTIQQQFCNTNQLIEANTREVQNQGNMTRQLLVDQSKDAEIARLNREINDLSQSRQTLEFVASQQAQSANIIEQIRKYSCNPCGTCVCAPVTPPAS